MAQYYFLVSLLPTLEIGHPPQLGWAELMELVKINLKPQDRKKVRDLLRLTDLENLHLLWQGQTLDVHGNLSKAELEKALENRAWSEDEPFKEYLVEFLDTYPEPKEAAAHFSELLSQFLLDQIEKQQGFLKKYYYFERQLRLVLVGWRAKRLGKDVIAELNFEDPREPLVAEIIAQKDAPTFEPPFAFVDFKPFIENRSTALEVNRAIVEYRFMRLSELAARYNFDIDRVLSYIARLALVERGLALNHERGMQLVHTIEEKNS